MKLSLRSPLLLAGVLTAALLGGCAHPADDDRIPQSNVYLPFTQGLWNVYAPAGAGDYAYFIKDRGIPTNFPYAAMHETGYAGILLVVDYLGMPRAYSLACPVERSNRVLLTIRNSSDSRHEPVAYCADCHSEYDVFMNGGTPIAGEANQRGYALTRYRVTSNPSYPYIIAPEWGW